MNAPASSRLAPPMNESPARDRIPLRWDRTEGFSVQRQPISKAEAPFGWPAVALTKEPIAFHSRNPLPDYNGIIFFRLTCAVDSREDLHIVCRHKDFSDECLIIDIRRAGMLQPFEVLIPSHWQKNGHLHFQLSVQENCPLFIFDSSAPVPPAHQPHLRHDGQQDNLIERLWKNLCSQNSLQPFGWCEGCVLDAWADRVLASASSKDELRQRLNIYFRDDGSLYYWDHLSHPRLNEFYGVEALHPFATLARIFPDHPAIPRGPEFLLSRRSDNGIVCDQGKITSEGFLVVAWVLAACGDALSRFDWIEEGARQARLRINKLVVKNRIVQRVDAYGDAHRVQWARGLAWTLLGLARLLPILRSHHLPCDDLEDSYHQVAQIAMSHQREDGLWSCFIDDPASGIETSGSAGIAAGLALGGVVDSNLDMTAKSLKKHLTSDGCLTGISQLNKGDESLQRCAYRVLGHFGTGLFGQFLQAWRGKSL